jgi:septal ring factor EnvC (AmiA/AmiB activator)
MFLLAFLLPPLWAQSKAPAKAPAKTATKAKAPAKAKSTESAVVIVEREMRQKQGALDSVKTELEKGRAQLRQLQREEGNYLSRLEQLERNISAGGVYIGIVQRQIDTTEQFLVILNDSLARSEVQLKTAREVMKRRLRNIYMAGEENRLQKLLSARSPAEFVHRIRYFQDLNRYDRELSASIQESIISVSEKKSVQESSRRELQLLIAGRKKEQQQLLSEEASRRTVLEDIRTKKSSFSAMVAELEAAQRELDAIVNLLEGRRKRAKEEEERMAKISFEKRKGKLAWPVSGRVISKYGRVVHPVYQTVIMNDGIDISAQKGASVKSVAAGTVAHVGSMRGLGRLVIVDHAGGFMTIYAHLDQISVARDQAVELGTELGKVGETGTAGGAKLQFQIRKAAETLNPEEWLQRL